MVAPSISGLGRREGGGERSWVIDLTTVFVGPDPAPIDPTLTSITARLDTDGTGYGTSVPVYGPGLDIGFHAGWNGPGSELWLQAFGTLDANLAGFYNVWIDPSPPIGNAKVEFTFSVTNSDGTTIAVREDIVRFQLPMAALLHALNFTPPNGELALPGITTLELDVIKLDNLPIGPTDINLSLAFGPDTNPASFTEDAIINGVGVGDYTGSTLTPVVGGFRVAIVCDVPLSTKGPFVEVYGLLGQNVFEGFIRLFQTEDEVQATWQVLLEEAGTREWTIDHPSNGATAVSITTTIRADLFVSDQIIDPNRMDLRIWRGPPGGPYVEEVVRNFGENFWQSGWEASSIVLVDDNHAQVTVIRPSAFPTETLVDPDFKYGLL